jgi:hypothetical protein
MLHLLSKALSLLTLATSSITTRFVTPPGPRQACQQLKYILNVNQTIVTDSGVDFDNTIAAAWNGANQQLRPACAILPTTASHVQVAMKTIFDTKVRYAVQSGGHSGVKGWNKYVSISTAIPICDVD